MADTTGGDAVHQSAYDHMRNCVSVYLDKNKLHDVIDIGSCMVDDQKLSHRMLLKEHRHNYIGLDVVEGENVDVVMRKPYRIPLKNSSVDVVICGQVFEHVPLFWISFLEMTRILRNEGYIFMTVPSRGHVHASRNEFDCWRFYPDSMRALAAFSDLSLLHVHTDFPPKKEGSRAYDYSKVGPGKYWGDTVAVFQKTKRSSLGARVITEALVWWGNRQATSLDHLLSERSKTALTRNKLQVADTAA